MRRSAKCGECPSRGEEEEICLNGAAARMVSAGDKVIIMCYAQMTPEEAKENPPKVVFVDEENRITSVSRYEKHGALRNMTGGEGEWAE